MDIEKAMREAMRASNAVFQSGSLGNGDRAKLVGDAMIAAAIADAADRIHEALRPGAKPRVARESL